MRNGKWKMTFRAVNLSDHSIIFIARVIGWKSVGFLLREEKGKKDYGGYYWKFRDKLIWISSFKGKFFFNLILLLTIVIVFVFQVWALSCEIYWMM